MLTSQAMVNPGGTGIPRFVISARLAPFPPSTFFMSRVPSSPSAPKKYTDLGAPDAVSGGSAAAAKAELVGVRGRRGGVVTGEACVAKAVRAVGNGFQHSVQREIAE